jgi:O-antigen/teichoic acid export membrane protein
MMVPLYIRYMGAEAYGLVGFFAMLQAWFNLLDMGLTPTMARESARYHGGAGTAMEYRRLARALEGVFAVVAVLGGGALFAMSGAVAARWLNAGQLPLDEVTSSLQLMALVVALRWMCGLYRGVITGAEKLVMLSGLNSLVATLRFVAVVPVLMFISASPRAFFSFQLVVALFELLALAWIAYRLLPAMPHGQRIKWEWAPLKPVLKFSLSIAFTSSVWVMVTQTDKLVLSEILPLADYGYYAVAVLAASGIMVISGPVSSALMPRMARLQAQGQTKEVIEVYRQATQLITVIALPAAMVMVFFPAEVLWAWTGDAQLVAKVAPVLRLYAGGYAFLAVGAFPYYLQYARGDLRLHVIGNALFVLTLVPSIIWAATRYGMLGAGWAWLISNASYFFAWVPLVHRRHAPGLHMRWVINDVLKLLLPALLLSALMGAWLRFSDNRAVLATELASAAVFLLVTSTMFSDGLLRQLKTGSRSR